MTGDGADVDDRERYALLGMLGRGGMGVVLRARDLATGREVALKRIDRDRPDRTTLERFRREGQLTAALDHPGIVRVFAAGLHEGRPYLAYELVEGARPLADVLREADLRRRVELVRDVARALGHAHARGVVHRDVKPDNVLVDASGRVRVTDFGLATAAGLEHLTRTGVIVGTPSFMAPEQIAAQRGAIGPATDVWALGVLLFEALTDELPFEGESLLDLGARILAGAPSPRSVDPAVPRALEAVCRRALEQAPADRHADGEALAQELDRWLEGEDVAPRGGRRLALAAGLASAGALALVALVALVAAGRGAPAAPTSAAVSDAPAVPRRAPAPGPQPAPAAREPSRPAAPPLDPEERDRISLALVVAGKSVSDRDLERFLAASPDDVAALLVRFDRRMDAGAFAEALLDAERAMAAKPDAPEPHLARGRALMALGRAWDAVECLTEGLRRFPDDTGLLKERVRVVATGAPAFADLALSDLDHLLRRKPAAVVPLTRSRVQLLQSAGRGEQVEPHVRALLDAHHDPQLLLLWIDVLPPTDASFREALARLDERLAHDPEQPDLRRRRADLLWLVGRAEEAVHEFAALVEQSPADAGLRAALARSLLDTGARGAALEQLERAAALATDVAIIDSIGLMFGHANEPRRGIEALEAYRARRPEDAEHLRTRLEALRSQLARFGSAAQGRP